CRCCTEPTLSKEAEIGALGPHHGNPLYQEQYYATKEPAAVAKAKRETSAVASSRVQQPCTREICAVYAIRFRSSWRSTVASTSSGCACLGSQSRVDIEQSRPVRLPVRAACKQRPLHSCGITAAIESTMSKGERWRGGRQHMAAAALNWAGRLWVLTAADVLLGLLLFVGEREYPMCHAAIVAAPVALPVLGLAVRVWLLHLVRHPPRSTVAHT
ncbi:hypothetical protein MTO96_051435, partial [Rhipicephalus appendiculatus]